MSNEDLVDQVIRNLLRREALMAAAPDVEEKLLTVAELDEPTCGSLLRPHARHAGTKRHHPHFILPKRFRRRIVDIELGLLGRGSLGQGRNPPRLTVRTPPKISPDDSDDERNCGYAFTGR